MAICRRPAPFRRLGPHPASNIDIHAPVPGLIAVREPSVERSGLKDESAVDCGEGVGRSRRKHAARRARQGTGKQRISMFRSRSSLKPLPSAQSGRLTSQAL